MNAIQIQLSSLPLALQLHENGLISIVRMSSFKCIIDAPEQPEAVSAMFDNDGFRIGKESYAYGVVIEYKQVPDVLQWLQQQGLVSPF